MSKRFLKYETENTPICIDDTGTFVSGKRLVYSYEVTDGQNLAGVYVDIPYFRKMLEEDRNFIVAIVYEYYSTTYRAFISKYSGTVKTGDIHIGFSGSCTDEWGTHYANIGGLANEDRLQLHVTVKSGTGTLMGLEIYEIA